MTDQRGCALLWPAELLLVGSDQCPLCRGHLALPRNSRSASPFENTSNPPRTDGYPLIFIAKITNYSDVCHMIRILPDFDALYLLPFSFPLPFPLPLPLPLFALGPFLFLVSLFGRREEGQEDRQDDKAVQHGAARGEERALEQCVGQIGRHKHQGHDTNHKAGSVLQDGCPVLLQCQLDALRPSVLGG